MAKMPLIEKLKCQPRWLVISEAFVLVSLIGWIDFITGWEWSVFIFYAVPIVATVWKAGPRAGYLFASFCAVIWVVAQLADNPYRTGWGLTLAAIGRQFYFVVLVVAVAAVRTRREMDRARIASLERTQQLEREILRTSEREQQRIGRDLHDSLGPHLAAINYAATFLANDLRLRHQPEAAKAEQVRDLATSAIALTRGLARGIFPTHMEGPGLAVALKELAETTSHLGGVEVSFHENGDTTVANPEAGMQLYRIAQEAVNNAVRHGAAKNVTLVLSQDEGEMRLVIADDGKGLPPLAEDTSGVGLRSMKHRAHSLSGTMKFESHADEGTIVTCQVPLRSLVSTPNSP
jgi:signal transduction histidine kinase